MATVLNFEKPRHDLKIVPENQVPRLREQAAESLATINVERARCHAAAQAAMIPPHIKQAMEKEDFHCADAEYLDSIGY